MYGYMDIFFKLDGPFYQSDLVAAEYISELFLSSTNVRAGAVSNVILIL